MWRHKPVEARKYCQWGTAATVKIPWGEMTCNQNQTIVEALMFRPIFSLIGGKNRKQIFLLLPVMLLGSLLEMAGVGLLVSVCALLMDGSRLQTHPAVLWVCGRLGMQPGQEFIAFVLFALVALYVIKLLYLAWENYIVARFVRISRSEVAARLFRRIIRAPYPFFIRYGTAEIQNLLGRDMDQLGQGLNACMQLLLEGLVALGMVIFLILVEPVMTCFAAVGIAILMLLTRLVLNRIIQRMSLLQRAAGKARWTWLHQAVAGIKDIRVGQREDFFSQHFEEANLVFARAEYHKQFWTRLPSLCIETVVVLSVLAYLLFLTLNSADLSRYLPGLSAMALTAVRLMPTCNRINTCLTQIGSASASVDAICRAMKETEPTPEAGMSPRINVAFTQGVSLSDVSYAYESGTETVLEHVDMDVPAGTSVGIIGPSGAGKSTMLDILLGLLVVERGQVLVDGIPIDQCWESYLSKTAYVPQTTFLLDGTIRDNVAFGEEPGEIDDKCVWEALEKAALADKVRSLPSDLDTQIGERGIRLSGGERQRLGLARALYRDPALIVFDEATSALDLETESAVMDSIHRLKGQKTLVIVSHRASAISGCDRIYRVQDRKVVRER